MSQAAGRPVLERGPAEGADAVMVMLHGRGASAEDILTLVPDLDLPGWRFLAPQAAGGAWYPNSFMAAIDQNEPWLSSALRQVGEVLDGVAARGIATERTVLLGFSQGACLALEFAARNPRRYGGLVGLSGGLIGPDDGVRPDAGSLAGTPVFLGCSDHDPYIPAARVIGAATALEAMDADVTRVLYAELGHAVNEDELEHVRGMMRRLAAESGASS